MYRTNPHRKINSPGNISIEHSILERINPCFKMLLGKIVRKSHTIPFQTIGIGIDREVYGYGSTDLQLDTSTEKTKVNK